MYTKTYKIESILCVCVCMIVNCKNRFYGSFMESQTSQVHLQDTSPAAFEILWNSFYCKPIDSNLKKLSCMEILEAMELSQRFGVPNLKSQLSEQLTSVAFRYVITLLHLYFHYNCIIFMCIFVIFVKILYNRKMIFRWISFNFQTWPKYRQVTLSTKHKPDV